MGQLIEIILLVGGFGSCIAVMLIIGAYSFFFTHQAIDFNLKLVKRFNFLKKEPEPPVDPHGIVMYSYYRTVGFVMLLFVGLPIALSVCLILKTISEGGQICVAGDYNCIRF